MASDASEDDCSSEDQDDECLEIPRRATSWLNRTTQRLSCSTRPSDSRTEVEDQQHDDDDCAVVSSDDESGDWIDSPSPAAALPRRP